MLRHPPLSLPDTVRVCNCADCGLLLLAREHLDRIDWLSSLCGQPLEVVHERILDRPYCRFCLLPRPAPNCGTKTRMEDDGGPWQQNAVRALEGE